MSVEEFMIAHSRTISVYAMAVSLEVEAWNGLLAIEEGEVASDANRLRIRSFGKLKFYGEKGGSGGGGDVAVAAIVMRS
jgi:hypothetical protein